MRSLPSTTARNGRDLPEYVVLWRPNVQIVQEMALIVGIGYYSNRRSKNKAGCVSNGGEIIFGTHWPFFVDTVTTDSRAEMNFCSIRIKQESLRSSIFFSPLCWSSCGERMCRWIGGGILSWWREAREIFSEYCISTSMDTLTIKQTATEPAYLI